MLQRRRVASIRSLIIFAAFLSVGQAHMELLEPLAVYSKGDPQTPEANKDYSMTSPLDKAGADWPAKKRCTSEILSALNPVATLVSGEDFEWNLGGTAVHNGGSCQVGISYDSCETMVVLASWIGGCPLSLPYTFKVPDLPGADRAFFVWAWSNRSGNRELYQNVAVVAVQGSASEFVGPSMFRANTFGDGVCNNPETIDIVYPAPGDQVFYGGDYSDASPPSPSFSCAEWDNTKTVTVKNSGGGSGPTGGSPDGGDKPEETTKPEQTSASSSGNAEATSPPGSSSSGGEGTASTGVESGGTGSTSAETGKASSSSKSPTASSPTAAASATTSPSSTTSDENSANFIKFAIGVLVVLALGSFAVCFFRHRSTSDRSYSRADDSDEDSDSDSSDTIVMVVGGQVTTIVIVVKARS
ncbi:uncharacterized protein JCM6883_000413 [Sporobolomyces salmoneus]|uniref:uncharacterized protein n=1 Tax=Sporobolomyces salmoneus TaxID=183962 RepID=UPI00317DEC4E